jgi:hypothetical protein
LGIVFAVVFGFLLVLCLLCLRKHGESHLPAEKGFRLISRRWQWYWLIVTATIGMISGFTAIDVDRFYIQGAPLILRRAGSIAIARPRSVKARARS